MIDPAFLADTSDLRDHLVEVCARLDAMFFGLLRSTRDAVDPGAAERDAEGLAVVVRCMRRFPSTACHLAGGEAEAIQTGLQEAMHRLLFEGLREWLRPEDQPAGHQPRTEADLIALNVAALVALEAALLEAIAELERETASGRRVSIEVPQEPTEIMRRWWRAHRRLFAIPAIAAERMATMSEAGAQRFLGDLLEEALRELDRADDDD